MSSRQGRVMTNSDPNPGLRPRQPAKPLPNGYRQGVITAITVMLGFTLYFFQYWSFEAAGEWTPLSRTAALLMLLSAFIQLVALWRSLQVADDQEPVYQRTLYWFLAGMITVVISVLLAAIAYSGLFGD